MVIHLGIAIAAFFAGSLALTAAWYMPILFGSSILGAQSFTMFWLLCGLFIAGGIGLATGIYTYKKLALYFL